MRISPLAHAVVLALAATSAPVLAQAAKAPLTATQAENANFRFVVLMQAMKAKEAEVPAVIKNALFTCIYENPFAKISDAMDQAIKANPGKIDQRNPGQVLGLMARICGYDPALAPAKGH